MPRQTMKQKIAALEAAAANLRLIAQEALRERDDARADLVSIPTSLADSRFCARLANVVFCDKTTTERNAVGFDDVAERVCALLATEEAVKELVFEVMEISNNPAPLVKQIDEAKSKAFDLRRTQESWDALPDNYTDWADLIQDTPLEPADVAKMVELLDLLGLSGNLLIGVLASSDMQAGLAAYK